MKFRIADKEYNARDAVEQISLQTLVDLKRSSGIGIKSLVESTKKFGQYKDPLDLLDNLESLDAFRVLIWLARRHAGEKLTLEQANSFPLNEFALIVDDDEVIEGETVDEPDPKALQGSGQDVNSGRAGRTRPGTSRTSKRP